MSDWTKQKGYYKRGTRIGFSSRGKAIVRAEIQARGGKCESCGRASLKWHWHHRPEEQKNFIISRGLIAPVEELRAELAKCDLLCPDCHEKAHSRPHAKGKRRIK